MHSDRYVHPDFGLLSPTPRLRRELRMVFFSGLLGIAVGAAAVIALSGNKNLDDAQISGLSSASVINEEPTEQGDEVKEHTSKSPGTKAQVNSEANKYNATTTCEGTNPCGSITLPRASKSRATRMPAANEAVAIGRAPLGRSSTEMAAVVPTISSERAQSTAGTSEETTADHGVFKPIMDRKPHNSARIRLREHAANYRDHRGASRIGRAYERRALDHAYALDRSSGPNGFWNWSR
jgi:hypothetical protein